MENFDYFNHVENKPLRTYNRLMFLENLLEFKGRAYAEEYILKFNNEEKTDLSKMKIILSILLKKHQRDMDLAKKELINLITKDMYFSEYPSEGETVH